MKLKAFLNTPRQTFALIRKPLPGKFCLVLLVLYHTAQRYRQVTAVTS